MGEGERAYDLRVAPGYTEFDGAIASCLAALEDGMPARWWTHLFVHAADRTLIGAGGCTRWELQLPGSTNRGGGA